MLNTLGRQVNVFSILFWNMSPIGLVQSGSPTCLNYQFDSKGDETFLQNRVCGLHLLSLNILHWLV